MAVPPRKFADHLLFPSVKEPFKGPWEVDFFIFRKISENSGSLVLNGKVDGKYHSIDEAFTAANSEAMAQLLKLLSEF